MLEQAIARDPKYGPALAAAACCHLRAYLDGWSNDPQLERFKGVQRARQALAISPHDPVAVASATFALTEFGEDIGAVLPLMDRALTLNPSYARGWFLSAAIRLDLGQIEIAIDHLSTSLRLNPRDRIGAHFSVLGSAYLFSKRFDQAEERLLIAIGEHPSHPFPYWLLAACYAHVGRLVEAQDVLNRLRAVTPILTPSALPYRQPEHRELLLSGLRAASGES